MILIELSGVLVGGASLTSDESKSKEQVMGDSIRHAYWVDGSENFSHIYSA